MTTISTTLRFFIPIPLSIDVLQIGLITVISLFTWRIWRFTMRPLMVPHEPREVPYWVPYIGRLDFLFDFDRKSSNALQKLSTHEPVSVTIAGETLYLVSDPSDAAELARNPAISRDPLVVDIYAKLGIPRDVAARLLAVDPEGAANRAAGAAPSFSATARILELYREYLSPGPELDDFFERDVLPRIQVAFPFNLDSDYSNPSSLQTKDISLHSLVTTAQITSLLGAFYGDLLFTLEPEFMAHYLVWEKVNWKFVFGLPRMFSGDMLAAQRALVGAFVRYAAVPAQRRGHTNEWTERVEALLREKGLRDEDMGWILMMQTWAILGNTFKATFWLVAYILADPALVQVITAEVTPALSHRADSDCGELFQINHQYLSEHCPQLDSLYSEVLRLTMTAPMVRHVVTDTVVGGKMLRGGNKVMVLYRHLHLHPPTWGSTPQTLSPTRFLHDPSLKNTAAYRPFGAGRHVCPGRYLARKAVFAFVACLLGGFEVVEMRVVSESNSKRMMGAAGKAGGGAGGFAAMPEMDMSKPTPGIASISRGEDVILRLRRR